MQQRKYVWIWENLKMDIGLTSDKDEVKNIHIENGLSMHKKMNQTSALHVVYHINSSTKELTTEMVRKTKTQLFFATLHTKIHELP